MKVIIVALLTLSASAFAGQIDPVTNAQKMDLIRMVDLSPAPQSTHGDGGAYKSMLAAVTSYVEGSSSTISCTSLAPQRTYDQCTIMLLTSEFGTENTIHIVVDANLWADGSVSLEQIESVQYP